MNTEFIPESAELQKLLLLDSLATRYHKLPSEIINSSDTLDILVMDAAISYNNYISEKEEAKRDGKPPVPKLPVERLQAMIDKTKEQQ